METIELMDIKTHLMSDDIRQLAPAFLQAKMAMQGAKKNSKSNLHKYANLSAVYEAVEEALHANNIFIWHFAERLDDSELVLHTRLIHAPTGQFVQDTRPLRSEKPGNQAMGSANTYMRRYAVLSLCALETEDDDGESERHYIDNNSLTITEAQKDELRNALRPYGNAKDMNDYLLKVNRISTIDELPQSKLGMALGYIRKNGVSKGE